MPTVTFIASDGSEEKVSADSGTSLMQAAIRNQPTCLPSNING